MRIAIVSDIHGNLTAFEAVLADLRKTSPDLILHGGDLPHGGANPAEIVDRIRDLGWQGVAGNTDEMLWRPEALTEFAAQTLGLEPLFNAIKEMAATTAEILGEERLAWLKQLPSVLNHGPIALVHAAPASLWKMLSPEAIDADLEAEYALLAKPIVVYGHIHRSFVRRLHGLTLINSGSVSMSYDGDPRAAYLVLDDQEPTIRRVEYEVDREIEALTQSGIPHADWVARTLKSAKPEMP